MLNELLRNRLVIVAISLILIGLIGMGVYTLMDRAGKEPVTVYAIPGDATLTANGKRIGTGTAYLKPGTYTIEAKKEGFESTTATITVTQPNTAVIDIALNPISEEAKKWQEQNKKLYYEHEGRVGERANLRGEEFSQANPITSKLPYENPYYTIGYTSPDGKTVELTITATSALYRYNALVQLRSMGYDPADFKILYTGYVNPLEKL